mgnify:CR=1 FL=1
MFIIYVFFAFLLLNFLWEVLRTLSARSADKVPVAGVTSVAPVAKNDRKVVTLAQAKPELKDYELLQARDRICKKNGIRGIDVVNYEAVLVKTSSGWITTIQRRHV